MSETSTSDLLFSRFEAWYAEARACKTIAYANAMTLATVNSKGQPSARVVLLKGVDAGGFVFYTNLNSQKSREIKENQQVALCFYWGETGKQVRIEGKASATSAEESDAYFATRPRESQLGAWASQQSQPLDSAATLKKRFDDTTLRFAGENVPRPPHWGGWRVIPHRIEFWEEGAFRLHKRTAYTQQADGSWRSEILNP
jgi:pyridoxamine 5'-phosphate oxidase